MFTNVYTHGWSVTRWRHIQPEGWRGVTRITRETRPRYVHREFIQLPIPALLTMWDHQISRYLYSWVENNSNLSRTHVARSTEPNLERFLILICREHKKMSRAFYGTVSPCCLFSQCRSSIAEYKTWLKSFSDWQFLFFQFADYVRDAYAKKTADEIPAEGNCQRFFRGRKYEQLEGHLFLDL